MANTPPPAAEPTPTAQAPSAAPIAASKQSSSTPAGTPSNNNANYISVNKDKPGPLSKGYKSSNDEDQNEDEWDMSNINVAPSQHIRRSKCVIQQLKNNNKDGLHRIAALAAKETELPPGILMQNAKYSRGYTVTNKNLKMD